MPYVYKSQNAFPISESFNLLKKTQSLLKNWGKGEPPGGLNVKKGHARTAVLVKKQGKWQ